MESPRVKEPVLTFVPRMTYLEPSKPSCSYVTVSRQGFVDVQSKPTTMMVWVVHGAPWVGGKSTLAMCSKA